MNDKDIKDKAIFIVGFLAVFLALSSFKDELKAIHLLIGEGSYSLFHIILFFVTLLTISTYLYALDYLKYSFSRYQNSFIFKWIIPTANFFYFIAILYPILVLLFWIIGSGPLYNFTKQNTHTIRIFDLVGVLSLGMLGIYSAYLATKKAKIEEIEKVERLKTGYLQKALQLFENKFYGETVIETYKVLEQLLREKLLREKNLTTRYISIKQLIELALNKKILDKKSVHLIDELRIARNKGVHSSEPITRENAEFFINSVRTILETEEFKGLINE
jgi:HEPN domain-containing protein